MYTEVAAPVCLMSQAAAETADVTVAGVENRYKHLRSAAADTKDVETTSGKKGCCMSAGVAGGCPIQHSQQGTAQWRPLEGSRHSTAKQHWLRCTLGVCAEEQCWSGVDYDCARAMWVTDICCSSWLEPVTVCSIAGRAGRCAVTQKA